MFSWIFSSFPENEENTDSNANSRIEGEFQKDWELLGRPAKQMLEEVKDDFDDTQRQCSASTAPIAATASEAASGDATDDSKCAQSIQSVSSVENVQNPTQTLSTAKISAAGPESEPKPLSFAAVVRAQNSAKWNSSDCQDYTSYNLDGVEPADAGDAGDTAETDAYETGELSDEDEKVSVLLQNFATYGAKNGMGRDLFDEAYYSRKSGTYRNKKAQKKQKLKAKFISKRAQREMKREMKRKQRPAHGMYK